jgi:DNA-binding PadR family transcriptional regulator
MTRPLTATQYDALWWVAKLGVIPPPSERRPLSGLCAKGYVTRVERGRGSKRYSYFVTQAGVDALRETDRARREAVAS